MKNKKRYYFLTISIIIVSLVLITSLSIVTGQFPFFNDMLSGNGIGGNGDNNGSGTNGNFVDISINGSALEKQQTVYEINTNYEGNVWFHTVSYGNYTKTGWNNHNEPFYCSYSELSPFYFTSQALTDSTSYDKFDMNIKKYDPKDINLIPYYTINGPNNSNDFFVDYPFGKEYNVTYMPSMIVSEKDSKLSSEYDEVEERYYEYCLKNYLNVPNSTNDVLLKFMDMNNLSISNEDSYEDVYRVIKNFKSEVVEESDLGGKDLVIDLIQSLRIPNSLNYATTAAMIYRNLNIPSRVAGGYIKEVVKDTPTLITSKDHICWTEIYVRKIGWIPINVTPDLDEFYGKGTTSLDNPNNIYHIKPYDIHHKFDNKEVNANDDIQGLSRFLDRGFTYDAKVSGKRKELGISNSYIKSFNLYDPRGNNVTDNYNFDFDVGIVQVYDEKLIVKTDDIYKIYDGENVVNDKCDITYYEKVVENNHRIVNKEFITPFKNVDRKLNTVSLTIVDYDDQDVTDHYYIINDFGYIDIDPKPLKIITDGCSKYDDGKILTKKSCTTIGLVEGDELDIIINGYQEGIGSSKNTISKFDIIDKETKESVVNNYKITYEYGILEIK